MDIEILKPYLDQTKCIKPLKDYFDRYNAQLREAGIRNDSGIDTSKGLVGIMRSIDAFENNPYRGRTGAWDYYMWAHDARRDFCESVFFYFGMTGKVPGYNVEEMLESVEFSKMRSTENPTINPAVKAIIQSFPKFTEKLKKKSRRHPC